MGAVSSLKSKTLRGLFNPVSDTNFPFAIRLHPLIFVPVVTLQYRESWRLLYHMTELFGRILELVVNKTLHSSMLSHVYDT